VRKFLILIFLLIFPLLLINPGLGRFYDSPRYICLAYSIAKGNGYRFIFDPANKACFYNNFVFPYFLAPFVKLFGINFSVLKGLMLLLALLSTLMYSKWLENILSTKESLYTSILLLFSPLFIMFADKIMSEMLFLCFLCLSLYIFEISQRAKKKLINFSLFTIVYLLIFTRIVGIALLFS
jgi:4-amino-4-deoxy-L-arabinose transferase-like glycosyltransferase